MTDKTQIRRIVAARKKEYSDDQLSEMSGRIISRIRNLPQYDAAETVFAYMDLPGEVKIRELIKKCREDGKRTAVPAILSEENIIKQSVGDISSSMTGNVINKSRNMDNRMRRRNNPTSDRIMKCSACRPQEPDHRENGGKSNSRLTMSFFEIHSFDDLREGRMHIMEPDPETCECADGCGDALIIMPGVAFDRERNRVGYGGGFYDRYLSEHPGHPAIAACYEFQIFESVPHEEWDIRPQILVTPERVM